MNSNVGVEVTMQGYVTNVCVELVKLKLRSPLQRRIRRKREKNVAHEKKALASKYVVAKRTKKKR